MTMQRLPLAFPIETRDGSLSKDSLGVNFLYESRGDRKEIVKRPGLVNPGVFSPPMPTLRANGFFASLANLWAGVGGTLYKTTPYGAITSYGSVDPGLPFKLSFTQVSPANGFGNAVYPTAGTFSWTVPAGVTSLTYSVVGGGGNGGRGGNGSSGFAGGGGGGGGAGQEVTGTIGVTPGDVFSVGVAAAGGISLLRNVTTATTIAFANPGFNGTNGTNAVPPLSGTGGAGGANAGGGGVASITGTNGGLGSGPPVGGDGGYYISPLLQTNGLGGTTLGASGSAGSLGGGGGGGAGHTGTGGNGGTGGAGYISLTYSAGSPEGTIFFHNGSTAWTIAGGAGVTTPVGGAFPAGPLAAGAVYIDGYTMVATQAGRLYNSAIEDPTSWNALNFISVNSEPDPIVGIIKHLNYVMVGGAWSIDFVYDNQNASGSPFLINPSAKSNIGIANGFTMCAIDNTVAFVGQNKEWGRGVYLMDGLTPTKVSTRYIDKILNMDLMTDATAMSLRVSGHTLYILNLYNSNITIVFDMEEKVWYTWTTFNGVSESFFLAEYFQTFANVPYMLGNTTGKIYTVTDGTFSDDGNAIYARARTELIDSGTTRRKFYRKVVVVGDMISTTVQISHSGNDYNTFSTPRTISLSGSRPQLNGLASDRRRAWQLLHTDTTPLRIEALEIYFDVGGMDVEG